jgi:hypothetical protein
MVPTVCTMEGALCSMRWIYLALSLLEASDNWTHGTHEGFFFHCFDERRSTQKIIWV